METENNFLPTKLYEALRWIVCIVLPATDTFISGLNQAWNWGLPIEAILSTFSCVETFLGVVFLGAKLATDKRK